MADDPQQSRKAARFLAWLEAVGVRRGPGEHGRPARADVLNDAPSLIELAELAAAYAERSFERAGGGSDSAKPDCRRGCSYCCHLPVEASTAEAARALEYARGRLDEAGFQALTRRIVEASAAYPLSQSTPPAECPPCPFLVAGACQVYPARPLACRGWSSTDVRACEAAFRRGTASVRVPVDARRRAIFANASEALLRGLELTGGGGPAHLVPALAALVAPERR